MRAVNAIPSHFVSPFAQSVGAVFYPHESLWSTLHKIVLYSNLTGRQTRELVGYLGRQQTQPLLFPPESALDRLAVELELPEDLLSTCKTSAYLPGPLVSEFGSSGLLSKKLRFCRSCMGQGFHSPFHQLVFIDRCPFHDEPIVDACPGCGRPIDLAIQDHLIKNPYGCRCGYTFWRPEGTKVVDDQLRREATALLPQWVTWCQEISDRYCLFLFDSEFGFMPAAHDVLSDICASLSALSWLHGSPGLTQRKPVPPSVSGEISLDETLSARQLHQSLSRRAARAFAAWRVEASETHSECLSHVFDFRGTPGLWRDTHRCAISATFGYLSECWHGEENASTYLSQHWAHLVFNPISIALRKTGVNENEIDRWTASVSPALLDEVVAGTIDQVLSGHCERNQSTTRARPTQASEAQDQQWRFSPLLMDIEHRHFHLWGATDVDRLRRVLHSRCPVVSESEQ